jgi:hypothetical protein
MMYTLKLLMYEAFTYRAAQHCVGEKPSRNIRIRCQRKRWREREREKERGRWRERGRRAGWERAPSASHIGGGDARAGRGALAVTPLGRGCTGCGASGRGGCADALTRGAGGALEGRALSIPDHRLQRPDGCAGGIRADRWGQSVT